MWERKGRASFGCQNSPNKPHALDHTCACTKRRKGKRSLYRQLHRGTARRKNADSTNGGLERTRSFNVDLIGTPSGVLIRLNLTGIPPGEHAFHVHAVGKCEPPDFKSAGAHFNPDETSHGLMNPDGPHAGDMPNLHVPESGKLSIEVLNTLVTLREERPLLDEDSGAFIIHAGADDYTLTSNAGDRIACGVIRQ